MTLAIKTVQDVQALPFVPLSGWTELPLCAGIYFALDQPRSQILYVGSSGCLRRRWRAHIHRPSTSFIAWLIVNEASERYEAEYAYIQHFDPPLNHTGLLRVSPETAALIKQFARQDERSVTYVIRKLIEESPRIQAARSAKLKREKQKIKE